MILYILRHALAGQYGDPQWPDDSQRPLTEQGRDRFRCLASKLAQRGVSPRVIATSPYVRCRETANLLAEALDSVPDVIEFDALTPGADLEALVEWTSRQNASEVAWCGHAPDVGELTGTLIGEASVRFAKGAVAAIEFPTSRPVPRSGELRWHVTCKLLGC